jgi:hypothetical protein
MTNDFARPFWEFTPNHRLIAPGHNIPRAATWARWYAGSVGPGQKIMMEDEFMPAQRGHWEKRPCL